MEGLGNFIKRLKMHVCAIADSLIVAVNLQMSLAESFHLQVVALALPPSIPDGFALSAHRLKFLLEATVCLCRLEIKFSHFSISIFHFPILFFFLKTGLIAQSCFHLTIWLRVKNDLDLLVFLPLSAQYLIYRYVPTVEVLCPAMV